MAAGAVQPIRMSADQAKRLVILGVGCAGVMAVIASYRRGRAPSATIGVGVLASGAVLAGIADLQPSIAGGFGLVILVTSATVLGQDAWEAIADATRRRDEPSGAPELNYADGNPLRHHAERAGTNAPPVPRIPQP